MSNILKLLAPALVVFVFIFGNNVAGVTFCEPFFNTATFIINPLLPDSAVAETVEHEKVHIAQIRRLGCFETIVLQQTPEGQLLIEGEAFCGNTSPGEATDIILTHYSQARKLGRTYVENFINNCDSNSLSEIKLSKTRDPPKLMGVVVLK